MDPTHFGAEQVTEEDRGYRGSRFSEVRDALFANPYQRVWGGAGEPPLPIYDVTLLGVLRGLLPLGPPYFFSASGRQSRRRTVRFALGPGSQGIPADNSSERHKPDGSVGDFRRNRLFRLFPKEQSSAGGGALFDLLQGDPARPGTVLIPGRQAFSLHRSGPQRAAAHRQLYYPARPRRRSSLVRLSRNRHNGGSIRSPNSANRTANQPEHRLSCVCWSIPTNLESPATHWIFAMKSWRKFTIEATPSQSAP